jgi:ribokinase
MARLGAQVSLLTAVGPDALAVEARALWARERVSAEHVVTAKNPTMVGFILVDETGENRIIIAPGALDELTAVHVEAFRAEIAESDMLVVSMEIPMNAVSAALRIARDVATPALLNPAPATLLPEEVWGLIDYLTPNESEAPVLLGLPIDHGLSRERLLALMRARTGATIVLTLGAEGAAVDDGKEVMMIRPFPAERVVDTTGAGDSFSAALAVSLVEGVTLEAAVLRASAAGSHAVTIEGVIDALPTPLDIQNLIGQLS